MPISSVEYTNPMLTLQKVSVGGIFFGLINVTAVCDIFAHFMVKDAYGPHIMEFWLQIIRVL